MIWLIKDGSLKISHLTLFTLFTLALNFKAITSCQYREPDLIGAWYEWDLKNIENQVYTNTINYRKKVYTQQRHNFCYNIFSTVHAVVCTRSNTKLQCRPLHNHTYKHYYKNGKDTLELKRIY